MIDRQELEEIIPDITRFAQRQKSKGLFKGWETEDIVSSLILHSLKNEKYNREDRGTLKKFVFMQMSSVWKEYAYTYLNYKHDHTQGGKMVSRGFNVINTSFPDVDDAQPNTIHADCLADECHSFADLEWSDMYGVTIKKVDELLTTRMGKEWRKPFEEMKTAWEILKTSGRPALNEKYGVDRCCELIKNMRIKVEKYGIEDPRLG